MKRRTLEKLERRKLDVAFGFSAGKAKMVWPYSYREAHWTLLPKSKWRIWFCASSEKRKWDRLFVGCYNNRGRMAYDEFAIPDLPNDLITADDLKRLGIHNSELGVLIRLGDLTTDKNEDGQGKVRQADLAKPRSL